MKVDVTKEEDLTWTSSAISKWINDPSAKSSRHLHAVVNNAGIGATGLIDWTDLSVSQRSINGKLLLRSSSFGDG